MKPIHALFGCLMLGCNATLNSPQQIETVTIDEARCVLAWSDEFDGENGMPPNPMNGPMRRVDTGLVTIS